MMTDEIDRHELAALALALYARRRALEEFDDIDDVRDARGSWPKDEIDQWRESYQCALGWASSEWDETVGTDERIYQIYKNIIGNRWLKHPPD